MDGGQWAEEIAFFASAEHEQRPSVRFAAADTAWIHASKRVSGIRQGERVELPPVARALVYSKTNWRRSTSFRLTPPESSGSCGKPLPTIPGIRTTGRELSHLRGCLVRWRGPTAIQPRGRDRLPSAHVRGGRILARGGHDRVPERHRTAPCECHRLASWRCARRAKATSRQRKRASAHEVAIDGERYKLYFGELHTHFGEYPGDRTIETWTDQYYMNAIEDGVLN